MGLALNLNVKKDLLFVYLKYWSGGGHEMAIIDPVNKKYIPAEMPKEV
jgi:hypothetical protein